MIGGSLNHVLVTRACTPVGPRQKLRAPQRRSLTGLLAFCSFALFSLACSTDANEQRWISDETFSSTTWSMPHPQPDSSDPHTNFHSDLFPHEDGLRAAYRLRYESYWACLRAPENCDESYLRPESQAAQHMGAVREEMIARDRFVGPEPVGFYTLESVRISTDRHTAEVTACWWSTAVLYGAPIHPDLPVSLNNPSTLVTSTPEGGRQIDRFAWSGGRWLLTSSEALDAGFAQDPCSQ
jgi:hypothetical protein